MRRLGPVVNLGVNGVDQRSVRERRRGRKRRGQWQHQTPGRLRFPRRLCWCEGVLGAKGHKLLAARDEIEFPSLLSLRILTEFIRRRVAAFLEVLIRLQQAASSLFASVADSAGYFCTFNHARRLNALMQMQNTFAGIKPYCDVCNPITQTMRLLTPETTRPVHILLPTRIVATTVRKQDR